MSTHATGTFTQKKWDEKAYEELDGGRKLTRASVTGTFEGDIEGEGAVEYLMVYPSKESAYFVGLQRVTGRIGGRAGSFVLQVSGTYADGIARGEWFVTPGAGTGELQTLRGKGGFSAPHGPQASFTLDFDFE